MQFKPKTDKELLEMNLWPDGVYSFEILDKVTLGGKSYFTEERLSKKNNEMIQLVLRVYDERGGFITVRDYLMESMPHKLKHAAQALGLEDKYDLGILMATDFVGKNGKLELKIEKSKDMNYPDRNVVKDYVVAPLRRGSAQAALDAPLDDDVPF